MPALEESKENHPKTTNWPTHITQWRLHLSTTGPLQRLRNKVLVEGRGDYDYPFKLSQEARDNLLWWISHLKTHTFEDPNPTTSGPGNHIRRINDRLESHLWPDTHWGNVVPGEKKSTYQPLGAESSLPQTFPTSKTNVHIWLLIDNTTAIAYINRKEGTHFQVLSHTAIQMWEWCKERNISIQAHNQHIPGQENERADTESRRVEDYIWEFFGSYTNGGVLWT